MKKQSNVHSYRTHEQTDEIPPGATTRAADRPMQRERGGPGSGAGPRHAANDIGSPDEEYGAVDSNEPTAEPPQDDPLPMENGPAFAGMSGGAIGGSPAGMRTREGERDRPLYVPTSHRGDSTVGAGPERRSPSRKSAKGKPR